MTNNHQDRAANPRAGATSAGWPALLAVIVLTAGATPVDAQRSVPAPTSTGKVITPQGPAPTNLVVTGTPSTASLRWDRMAGISGYTVLRSMDAGQSWVTLTASALLAESFTDGSGLDPRMNDRYLKVERLP